MLFNSVEFILFLPVVFLIYWAIGYAKVSNEFKLRMQNSFVVVSSYVFYGWWNWRFLLLIAFTSFCSWGSGLLIDKATSLGKSKSWMIANVAINLAILGVFKYYDFFVFEFGHLFGISVDNLLLRVILPVGISFYTFQALSYSIDVYRKKIEPTTDIVAFFAFISFFPQLVAGPIERATNLLPQFLFNRKFSYDQAMDGIHQILWGLFKKIIVADNCAIYVDQVWATSSAQTGSTLLLAAILFTFQIYGDFSGYSDIAIGTAKLFGIKLMRNFDNPYFSRDIAEFWRRWHISLTTWFRDYVYIPLGGSRPEIPAYVQYPERRKRWLVVRNTFVIFLLSGFWHGANWTFIVWGAYHALLFLPLILLGKNRKYTTPVAKDRLFPTWRETMQMIVTFFFVVIGWIIFRSATIEEAWEIMKGIYDSSIFSLPMSNGKAYYIPICVSLFLMLCVEWFFRNSERFLFIRNIVVRKICCYSLAVILFFWVTCVQSGDTTQFIYFQF